MSQKLIKGSQHASVSPVSPVLTRVAQLLEFVADSEQLAVSVLDSQQVKIIPERVQQRTEEKIIDVPAPPAEEETAEVPQERISKCIIEQIVGPSLAQQSRLTPLEDTLPTWDKPACV